MYKKYRWPIIITAFILLTSIVAVLVFNFTHTAKLEVLVAPTTATITINGKTYHNGTHRMVPGDYTATIEQDGFISQSATFTITAHNTTNLYVILNPTDDNQSWYDEHPEDYTIMVEIGAKLNQQTREEFYAQYPELANLPVKVVEQQDGEPLIFRIDIDQSSDCAEDFCLLITDFTGNSQARAREYLADQGFDLTQTTVQYQYAPVEQAE